MPGKKIKFSRTETIAKSDRLTKWELIAAIAEDADEAGIPISGIESRLAAKVALDIAGSEYSDSTVASLCLVAKYDYESTAAQRRLWRRYGWTAVREFAKAGWSQSAAAEVLDGEHKGRIDINAVLATTRKGPGAPKGVPFDDRCAQWVHRAAKLMMDGANLMAEAETVNALGSHSELMLMIYQRMSDRHLDIEIKRLLDAEAVR